MKLKLQFLLQCSFKKLKSSVYFDKTRLILRDQIVEYECSDTFDPNFSHLIDLLEGEDKDWEHYSEDMLSTIRAHTFPKTLRRPDNKKKEIIFGSALGPTEVERVNYFFHSHVELQLLGVMWILTIGAKIDEGIYEHSYGNRLKNKLLDDKSGMPTFSPYLFKPYFGQYENWRDTGLRIAETYMDKNQAVLVFSLDLREFFYNVVFTEEDLSSFSNRENGYYSGLDSVVIRRINKLMISVLKTYSEKLPNRCNDQGFCLPIGYLPSNILSNWYLNEFDQAMSDRLNPLYYGRYVDDLLIVEKVEENSYIYEKAKNGQLGHEEAIKYYFMDCKSNPKVKCKNGKGIFYTREERAYCDDVESGLDRDDDIDNDSSSAYYVNTELLPAREGSRLCVQNSKIQMYYFPRGSSKALLTSFRTAIEKNKSEFRFLPDNDQAFMFGDYSGIYDLNRKPGSSINKFGELSSVDINKFSLSKFLGKLSRVTALIKDNKESQFEKDILRIFDDKTIVSNYIFWERILQVLLLNEKFDLAESFLAKVLKACKDAVIIDSETKGQSSQTGQDPQNNDVPQNDVSSMDKSMYCHLLSALNRTLALVWGPNVKDFIEKIVPTLQSHLESDSVSYGSILTARKNHCKTRMINKYVTLSLVDGPLSAGWEPKDDLTNINLSLYSDYVRLLSDKNKEEKQEQDSYMYFPYMVTLQDLEFMEYTKILNTNVREEELDFHCLANLKEKYKSLNYPNLNNKGSYILRDFFTHIDEKEISKLSEKTDTKSYVTRATVFGSGMDVVKVAIANARLRTSDLEGVLKGRPNRLYDRYHRLGKIVNVAIREGADVLVMPEAYVPFEWLHILAQYSAKNELAIITGVEHVKLDKSADSATVVNLTATILPYTLDDDLISAHINLRNKVHYSPEEKRMIRGYNYSFTEGKQYDLFCWNDFWFSVYCCFELASIHDRSQFASAVDAIVAVEWNRDTIYYSNIIESLGRDLHCYCIQANTSDYGDSRILSPTKSVIKDIVRTKGGKNDTVLLGEINISALRDFQLKEYELQKDDGRFKPTPPDFCRAILKRKQEKKLFEWL